MNWSLLILAIIVLYILYYLIRLEYKSQDCTDYHRPCCNWTPKAKLENPFKTNIDLTVETLRKNQIPVCWRRAMIGAILLALVFQFVFTTKFDIGTFILLVILLYFVLNCTFMLIFHYGSIYNIHIEKELYKLRSGKK